MNKALAIAKVPPHTACLLALAIAVSPPLAAATAQTTPPARTPAKVRVSQTFDWISTAPAAGILWLGVEEPYLVRLAPGCDDLVAAPPLRISVHGHRLQVGSDELFNPGGHCRIVALQPADRQQLQSTGLRRENARALVAERLTGPPRQK